MFLGLQELFYESAAAAGLLFLLKETNALVNCEVLHFSIIQGGPENLTKFIASFSKRESYILTRFSPICSETDNMKMEKIKRCIV